ncbi:MAG: DUF1211 domain-containing protein [Gammaproteobacteria bacterium]|nr:DUF1211 domain-containing protein [Gammaproteobacteria bacterium]
MEKLSSAFIDSCRIDNGLLLRGENMSRIETFVDAAFAFAFTMLVISIDEIPDSPAALLESSKDVPAFLASASTLGLIWLTHAQWSRTFGLQDTITIVLSLFLVMLVLIFVYPIKLMFRLLFSYLSGGFLTTGSSGATSWSDIANLIFYFGLGFISLALIIVLLYGNTLRYSEQLQLSAVERTFCLTRLVRWFTIIFTAVISCSLAFILVDAWIPWALFFYLTLAVSLPLSSRLLVKKPASTLSK